VEITRIHPDFKWERANGSRYNPAAESPAIHRTMTNLFSEIQETVGREEYYRTQFIRKYGYLYEQFEAANNIPEQFRDELALIAWVTNVLDLIGIKNIRPDETTMGEAGRLSIATPNPLRYLSPEATVKPTKDIGQGMTMTVDHDVLLMKFVGQHAQYEVGANSLIFSARYSFIISAIASAIDHQLGLHVDIKYESLFNFKRDRKGVRKIDEVLDVTHRFSQVAEPRNLLGYAWLCIAEQFNQSPDLLYYPCEGFELCGQELPFKRGQNTRNDGRPARRMHCSDTCRQRTKRELKGLVSFRDRYAEYNTKKINFQEYLDRRADMESEVLNRQIAGENAIEGIDISDVFVIDDEANE